MRKYTETMVKSAIFAMLGPFGKIYDTDTGGLGEWRDGRFVGRRGGTRTTPGYSDLMCFMRKPVRYSLYIEAKGEKTAIRPAQVAFCRIVSEAGLPAIIVRSPEAVLVALRFFGLLARPEWLTTPPIDVSWKREPWDRWPTNRADMDLARARFWQQRSEAPPPYMGVTF